jgi:hypothetical protein
VLQWLTWQAIKFESFAGVSELLAVSSLPPWAQPIPSAFPNLLSVLLAFAIAIQQLVSARLAGHSSRG